MSQGLEDCHENEDVSSSQVLAKPKSEERGLVSKHEVRSGYLPVEEKYEAKDVNIQEGVNAKDSLVSMQQDIKHSLQMGENHTDKNPAKSFVITPKDTQQLIQKDVKIPPQFVESQPIESGVRIFVHLLNKCHTKKFIYRLWKTHPRQIIFKLNL